MGGGFGAFSGMRGRMDTSGLGSLRGESGLVEGETVVSSDVKGSRGEGDAQTTQRKSWLARAISYCWIGSEDPVVVVMMRAFVLLVFEEDRK